MNRQTRRAMTAKQKMAKNAANVKHREQIDQLWEDLSRYQQLCFAIVRDQGRVRVPQAAFDGLSERDQLKFKKDETSGMLTVTYEPGAPEPEKKADGATASPAETA